MFAKALIRFARKTGLITSIVFLLTQSAACNSGEGDFKMTDADSVNSSNSIVHIVELSGEVTFANKKMAKGAKLTGTGTLKAIGESSWVDIEYLGGEIFRLNNGSIELSFGDELTSNIGGLDLGGGSTGTNTRIIKLKSGKLFVHIAKFEQLRKVQYYISSDIIYLNLSHGSFTLETNDNTTQVTNCEGPISIGPSYAIESSSRPTWPEFKLSEGNTVSVGLTDTPKPTALTNSEKERLSKQFNAMGVVACS